MEGSPADLTIYIDEKVNRDHTYYGNGCPNEWGGDGSGGSKTPCNYRILETSDHEDQEIGTYYHFQAATADTGGSTLDTNNTNATDSFCPLGWQLPYSGTGGDYYDKSKSFRKLLIDYSIEFNPPTSADIAKVMSYPLSYIKSGFFRWNFGLLYYASLNGFYWSPTVYDSSISYRFSFDATNLAVANLVDKKSGQALRCVKFLASPHRRHGGRN